MVETLFEHFDNVSSARGKCTHTTATTQADWSKTGAIVCIYWTNQNNFKKKKHSEIFHKLSFKWLLRLVYICYYPIKNIVRFEDRFTCHWSISKYHMSKKLTDVVKKYKNHIALQDKVRCCKAKKRKKLCCPQVGNLKFWVGRSGFFTFFFLLYRSWV